MGIAARLVGDTPCDGAGVRFKLTRQQLHQHSGGCVIAADDPCFVTWPQNEADIFSVLADHQLSWKHSRPVTNRYRFRVLART